jgi:hypothetical protein
VRNERNNVAVHEAEIAVPSHKAAEFEQRMISALMLNRGFTEMFGNREPISNATFQWPTFPRRSM